MTTKLEKALLDGGIKKKQFLKKNKDLAAIVAGKYKAEPGKIPKYLKAEYKKTTNLLVNASGKRKTNLENRQFVLKELTTTTPRKNKIAPKEKVVDPKNTSVKKNISEREPVPGNKVVVKGFGG